MLLYKNNYKGKHFILSDDSDEMFGDIGTIESDTIDDDFLYDHVDSCVYYGIPAYIGNDPVMKKRVDDIYKNFDSE